MSASGVPDAAEKRHCNADCKLAISRLQSPYLNLKIDFLSTAMGQAWRATANGRLEDRVAAPATPVSRRQTPAAEWSGELDR